ncbi:unnamed protein product [Lactuca saligna]|uniref:rRNA-processing protein FYV7 n=1 Tax=Lactuca saligna TaxID=75948 RepID=A0AA35ZX26_LACSI|nr:unnamed protein product [Lactuca saligna]
MKNNGRTSNDGGNYQKSGALAPVNNNKMKKNKMRMGSVGGGLSLQAFANAKAKNDGYNPALIKKQREFYKNAKCVNKYKKSQKQQNKAQDSSQSTRFVEGRSENREKGKKNYGNKMAFSLKEIYNKKREEEEKERMEKEAMLKTRKEEKEKSEARRKDKREKMFKRTRSGQPIMKYRIEHLLQTIQGTKD